MDTPIVKSISSAPSRETVNVVNTKTLKFDSVALSRILEEVRNDVVSAPNAYNRQHNRHNR